MSPRRILLVQTGTTDPRVIPRWGDYDAWFLRTLPGGADRCTVIRPFAGDPLPDPGDHAGLLLTGSPLSVRDEAPWMAELGRWAVEVARDRPVLGVCFGHQLLGETLGGRVARNPAGPEWGTHEVRLTEAGRQDPLFDGLPDTVAFQQTHADALIRLPEGAVPLATNEMGQQGFAWGHIRTVQFHPEAPAEALDALLTYRGHPRPVYDTPAGPQLLANWVRHYVDPA